MRNSHTIVIIFILSLLLALFAFSHSAASQPRTKFEDIEAVIYLNEECDCCVEYTSELVQFLNELGITDIDIRYLISNREFSRELDEVYRQLNIPQEYRTGYLAKIGKHLFIEGHPPFQAIENTLIETEELNETIIISQREMHFWKKADKYQLIFSNGRVLTCTVENFKCEDIGEFKTSELPLLLVVVSSGFLDGINPCAISLLVFFAIAIFKAAFRNIEKDKITRVSLEVTEKGAVFIAGVLIAYYSLGLGIIQTIRLIPVPHLAAKIFSIAVIVLSALELFSTITPKIERITKSYKPVFLVELIAKLSGETSIPLIFLIGFLTGLCTLPCSGSIYLAILSLLAVETSYFEGLFYLTVYNLAYISPLVIILSLSSNRRILGRISRMRNRRIVRITGNILALAIGIILAYISFSL